jgi:formate dehydrogenase iron-sulfur subunit
LLFDTTRCINCGACAAACKEQNALPLPIEDKTTAYTWTVIEQRAGVNVRRLCMHCLTPTCVSVCPVGAMRKTASGPVVYDADKCIGCRYCIMACPFDVPKYQWDKPLPIVGKCVLCASRLADGNAPACATVCPTGATMFGERQALIREAEARIAAAPDRYVHHVYGVDEAGGTSVLMLSSVPFADLGLRDNLPREPLPMLTWNALSRVPDVLTIGAALLYGIYWITKRREYVQQIEGFAGAVLPPSPPRDARTRTEPAEGEPR